MRVHYMKIIGNKTDADLLAWCNETLQLDTPLTGFGDAAFGDGKLLIRLAGSIEPKIIN